MRAFATLFFTCALFAAPAHADGLSITVCHADTIDLIQDLLELQGYTLLDPTASCVDGVTIIDPADQGPAYTAEVLPAWFSPDVQVTITDPSARAVVRAAIIAEGRVPPSGPSIMEFSETYDVGPLPIK